MPLSLSNVRHPSPSRSRPRIRHHPQVVQLKVTSQLKKKVGVIGAIKVQRLREILGQPSRDRATIQLRL